ncbi:MAG TPA: response regulator [Methylomirabilota bacterium]|nr:response regulator [Methylomirabilota bacterium]
MAWYTLATAALARHLPGSKNRTEAPVQRNEPGTPAAAPAAPAPPAAAPETPVVAAPRKQAAAAGSQRVLVIDDDAVTLLVISAALRDAGYEVIEARDGAEGLSLFHSKRVAAVVTDLVMPNHGGLETVKELRRKDPTVRIIVVSGVTGGSAEYLRTAVRFGADRVLPKPVDLRELIAMLAGLLAQTP